MKDHKHTPKRLNAAIMASIRDGDTHTIGSRTYRGRQAKFARVPVDPKQPYGLMKLVQVVKAIPFVRVMADPANVS